MSVSKISRGRGDNKSGFFASPVHGIDFNVDASGNDAVYTIAPDNGRTLVIETLRIIYAIDVDSSFLPKPPKKAKGTEIPFAEHLSFIGVVPVNGIVYERSDNSGVLASATVRKPLDVLQIPGNSITTSTDGVEKLAFLDAKFGEPISLDPALGAKITYTLSEDFSMFTFFRVGYKGYYI